MEISQWKEQDFSLDIDLYTNKTLHRHWRMGQVSAVTIFQIGKVLNHYGLSSRKRPPPISDHPGLTFWVVAYERFDCILIGCLSHLINVTVNAAVPPTNKTEIFFTLYSIS